MRPSSLAAAVDLGSGCRWCWCFCICKESSPALSALSLSPPSSGFNNITRMMPNSRNKFSNIGSCRQVLHQRRHWRRPVSGLCLPPLFSVAGGRSRQAQHGYWAAIQRYAAGKAPTAVGAGAATVIEADP
ncbi:hypothetical protein Vretifemale_4231 [Volvox reticuliferus]|uniref:Uncharacterized protein n=1 Tax=Volvox reticuliferus TaxID=1737510 RepID=A0A8J4C9C3_9CHLO|nr:hypothetical protein Vretifemale_4231 [Volvox reticuliferus]